MCLSTYFIKRIERSLQHQPITEKGNQLLGCTVELNYARTISRPEILPKPAATGAKWRRPLWHQRTTSSETSTRITATGSSLRSKVLLLRSFHSCQHVSMIMESKHFRSGLGTLLRSDVHQSAREMLFTDGARCCHPSLRNVLNQTSLDSGQPIRRWSMVSDD